MSEKIEYQGCAGTATLLVHLDNDGDATTEHAQVFDLWRAGFVPTAGLPDLLDAIADYIDCPYNGGNGDDGMPCICLACSARRVSEAMTDGPDGDGWATVFNDAVPVDSQRAAGEQARPASHEALDAYYAAQDEAAKHSQREQQ